MGDVDLLKKFQSIDNKTNADKKLELLENLKLRIKTDQWFIEFGKNKLTERAREIHEADYKFIENCIQTFKTDKLTAEEMMRINQINKKHKRIRSIK